MKRIKFLLLTSLFSSITAYAIWGNLVNIGELISEDASEKLAAEGLQAVSGVLPEAAEKVGSFGLQALAESLPVSSEKLAETGLNALAEALPHTSEKFAEAGMQTLAENLPEATSKFGEVAAIRMTQVYIAFKTIDLLYTLGKSLYNYTNPDPETVSRAASAKQKIHTMNITDAFRSCLMEESSSERNSSGLPTACQTLAAEFTMVAGRHALDEMAANFKRAYGE